MDEERTATNTCQLIARARENPQAFVELYRMHYDAVFRYCAHRLFDRTVAEDVTSDVFLKAVENINRFRGTDEQFGCWLYKIATNSVNNYLRKTARREVLMKTVYEQANSRAHDCGDLSERLALLKKAVLALNPRYQTIITLRFFENMKLTKIAEVLGSSPGTVRSQLARALAKLRKKLDLGLKLETEVIENE